MKDFKNKNKWASAALAGALALCMGVCAVSYGPLQAQAQGEAAAPVSKKEKQVKSLLSDFVSGKDETVYVLTGADGAVNKVIVSDWLKNPDGLDTIKDYTELEDPQNVKGEGGYQKDGDGIAWEAAGEDVYYQGTTEKAPPVEVNLSYTLDGQPIAPEELAGKSGRVTIHIDYVNHEKRTVEIGGQQQEIYVPFVAVTGAILDGEHFSNVSVTGGKLINDGDKSIVMGFALPGLKDSLGLSDEDVDLDIPESVEITCDAKDFALETVMTLVTGEMFNELDLDDVEDTAELTDAMQDLQEASGQLVDGSSALYDGLATLMSKSGELVTGIDQLSAGALQLKSGAGDLKQGADALAAGAAELNAGLSTLAANNDKLNGGAGEVFDSLLAAAQSQLKAAGLEVPALTRDNYGQVLASVLNNLDEDKVRTLATQKAKEAVTAQVKENLVTIRAGVESAVREQVLASVLQGAGLAMTPEQYRAAVQAGSLDSAVVAAVEQNVSDQMASSAVQGKIDAAVAQQVDALIEQNMQSDTVKEQIASAVAQAKSGAGSVAALKEQLDAYKAFCDGLAEYTAGVQSAYEGSAALSQGTETLSSGAGTLLAGAKELSKGAGTLKSGSGALVDGVGQLEGGAFTLKEGMAQFDAEGIQKLVEAFDGDLQGLIDRFTALSDAAKAYQSFTGLAEGTQGSVKFIYRTDAIGE